MVCMATLSSFYTPTTIYNPVNGILVGTKIDQNIASDPQKIIDNLIMVPKGTKVLSYYTKNNMGFLDLSHDFTDTVVEGEENTVLMVYSIVDTFCSTKGIDTLCIDTEGRMQFIQIKEKPLPIIFHGVKDGEDDSYEKIVKRLNLAN